MQLSDEEIQRSVLQELEWDSRVKPTEVGVVVRDGVVTLVGTVTSYMKKWQAEEIALRVRGVRAVANQLEVKLPSADQRSDEEIAWAAKQALERSIDIPDTVKVSVEGGVVRLRGEVEWQHQKLAAEHRVRGLMGVKGVINEIVVRPTASPTPTDLKRRIEEALVRAAETDAKNIQVEVQDGRVVLTGYVHSWYEREEAKREAWHAPGVREVVDRLEILQP